MYPKNKLGFKEKCTIAYLDKNSGFFSKMYPTANTGIISTTEIDF